jgi:hypothetical protein
MTDTTIRAADVPAAVRAAITATLIDDESGTDHDLMHALAHAGPVTAFNAMNYLSHWMYRALDLAAQATGRPAQQIWAEMAGEAAKQEADAICQLKTITDDEWKAFGADVMDDLERRAGEPGDEP